MGVSLLQTNWRAYKICVFVESLTKNQYERVPRWTSSEECVIRYVTVGNEGESVNEKKGRCEVSVLRNGRR
jgi:hypothetical protein